MRRSAARAVVAVVMTFVAVVSLLHPAAPVAAQDESPPETFPQPTTEATSEGPDSTAGELRAAQIGLISVAVVGLALVVVYWRHTGREARARFERERPRHSAKRRRRGRGGPGNDEGDLVIEETGPDG